MSQSSGKSVAERWLANYQTTGMAIHRQTQGNIDLRALKSANGSSQQIMLVEVKCFLDDENTTQELYTAIGQYLVYRAMLIELEDKTPLYLSIPEAVFRHIFDSSVLTVIRENQIRLLIVNLEQEVIVRWME